MRVLVCGSRSWHEKDIIRERLAILPAGSVIVHGGANGADKMAGQAARDLGLKQEVYLPDWNRHGKSAGFVRNMTMLRTKPNLVLAFWDGHSRGTNHTVEHARQMDIPVEVLEGVPAEGEK